VFLRTLEYYPGILFLTTNQVGHIDEAFKSRIKIQLNYPKIDRESTVKLWDQHLTQIEKQNSSRKIRIKFDRPKLIEYAQKHFDQCKDDKLTWNGRQVRNAFQTAVALAEYDRFENIRNMAVEDEISEEEVVKHAFKFVQLKVSHFEQVAKTAKHFETYLRSVHKNKSDDLRAHQDEIRDDDWNQDQSVEPQFRDSFANNL
jgi:hypothetical protein